MIYFENVSKHYNGSSVALEDVTFQVDPKEFVSIVGHSGAGKTSLLRMLIAEERPSSGQVFFESLDIHKIPRAKLPKYRRKIGTTVIMTTHNKGVIDELGRRVITMDEGKIVRDDQEGKYVL
jgi:ABC-type ATPase involved in cell division